MSGEIELPETIDVLEKPVDVSDWPVSAQRYALAEANSTIALRLAIDDVVGMESKTYTATDAHEFNKDELAAIYVALVEAMK